MGNVTFATVLEIFERVRQTPGAQFEADRLLAFLTDPPAKKGKRVADTFAGRRRLVRFINAVQLEFGICFTNSEWEQGLALDDFAALVEAKAAKPQAALKFARQRLEHLRRRRFDDPLKFGFIAAALLAVGFAVGSTPVRVAGALVWLGLVGGIVWLVAADIRYHEKLVARIEKGGLAGH